MTSIKKLIRKLINKTLLNYKHPYYNRYIYDVALRYVYFYQGECNPDMDTNGEKTFLIYCYKTNS